MVTAENPPLKPIASSHSPVKPGGTGVALRTGEVSVVDNKSGPGPLNGDHRVLIVDDEPLVRWSISETLREAGYTILEAGDARTALEQARESPERFDAILLDLWLPDSNDLALLRTLHGRVNAPIIVMTAHGTRELTQQALNLGAHTVLNKPFNMADVVTVVEEARSERARARQN